jgi:hypothetical protein
MIALRLCLDVAEPGPLILPLSIGQIQNARAAIRIVDSLQVDRFGRRRERAVLRHSQLFVMGESLQDVRDLSERLQ